MTKERVCERCGKRFVYRMKIDLDPSAKQLLTVINGLRQENVLLKIKVAEQTFQIAVMRSCATVRLFTKN